MNCRIAYSESQFDEEYPGMLLTVMNFLLYQGAWLACVTGAASGRPVVGLAVAAVVIGWHLNVAVRPIAEFKLILLTGLIGGGWESLLVALDWVRYEGVGMPGLAPYWIIALWLAFATTLNVSLHWLKGRACLASALGSLGGPLAWWAGERMGALHLSEGLLSLGVIGAGWAVLLPLLSSLAAWVDLQTPVQPRRF